MRPRRRAQFVLGLRQGDVERVFTAPSTLHQKAHGGGGRAGARIAFQQIDAIARQTAGQYVVETLNAEVGLRYRVRVVHDLSQI